MEKDETSVNPSRDFGQVIETFLRNHDLRGVSAKIKAIILQMLKGRDELKNQKERIDFAHKFARAICTDLKSKFFQRTTGEWLENKTFDVHDYVVRNIIEGFKVELQVRNEIQSRDKNLRILDDSKLYVPNVPFRKATSVETRTKGYPVLAPAWEIHYGDPHEDMELAKEIKKFEEGEITEIERLVASSVIKEAQDAEFYIKTNRGFPWEILRPLDRDHPLWVLFIAVGPEVFRKICFMFFRRKVKTIHFPAEKSFIVAMFTPRVLQLHKTDPEMACHRIAQIINEGYSEEGYGDPYFPVEFTKNQVRKIILDSKKQGQKPLENEVEDLNKIAKIIKLKKLLKLQQLEV